jgi:hypothetical protein
MAKGDIIELQQPLDYTDGGSGPSMADKAEIEHRHVNEHDQADMHRLGKSQKLDVCRVLQYH